MLNHGEEFLVLTNQNMRNLDYYKRSYDNYMNDTFYSGHDFLYANYDLNPTDKNILDIMIIVYYNIELLEYQIKLFKKFFTGFPHRINIFDDSRIKYDDMTPFSRRVKKMCVENDLTYIKLPVNPCEYIWNGVAYGFAINWAYHNYIKLRNTKYFSIIDNDMFPITKIDTDNIIRRLDENGAYGDMVSRKNTKVKSEDGKETYYYYFAPDIEFFNRSFVGDFYLDYRPIFDYELDNTTGSIEGDTGSRTKFLIESKNMSFDKCFYGKNCFYFDGCRFEKTVDGQWFNMGYGTDDCYEKFSCVRKYLNAILAIGE